MTFAIRDQGGIEVTEEDAAWAVLAVICGEWDSKHNTVNLAKRCIEDGIQGDFVECGVNAGGQPALMSYALQRYGGPADTGRRVHLFDSFQGQPKAGPDDCADYQKVLGVNEDRLHGIAANHFIAYRWQVESNMRNWNVDQSRLVYHEGWLQDVLPQLPKFPIALLRVDVDLCDSTTPVFEYLYEHVSPGGYIISDDWGQYALDAEPTGCRKAALAVMDRRGFARPSPTQLPRATGTAWWHKP